jgi:hypothetical protein
MQPEPTRPSASELDEDRLAFVRRVFGFARAGEAGELATLDTMELLAAATSGD